MYCCIYKPRRIAEQPTGERSKCLVVYQPSRGTLSTITNFVKHLRKEKDLSVYTLPKLGAYQLFKFGFKFQSNPEVETCRCTTCSSAGSESGDGLTALREEMKNFSRIVLIHSKESCKQLEAFKSTRQLLVVGCKAFVALASIYDVHQTVVEGSIDRRSKDQTPTRETSKDSGFQTAMDNASICSDGEICEIPPIPAGPEETTLSMVVEMEGRASETSLSIVSCSQMPTVVHVVSGGGIDRELICSIFSHQLLLDISDDFADIVEQLRHGDGHFIPPPTL